MSDNIGFDYYHGQEALQFSFYRVPKLLFEGEAFSELTCEAMMLYGMMIDRMCLSLQNEWKDKQGRVYIIFTIAEIKEKFRCREQKACNLLRQLEVCGLVEKKRRGLGMANILYVKNFIPPHAHSCDNHDTDEDDDPAAPEQWDDYHDDDRDLPPESVEDTGDPAGIPAQDYENIISCGDNFTTQRVRKPQRNDTYLSDTDFSDTQFYSIPEDTGHRQDGEEQSRKETYAEIQEYVEALVDYDILCERPEVDSDRLRELVCIMVEVLCSNASCLFVDGDMRPIEQVKARYRQIGSQVILHVLQCLDDNTTEVKKVKNYLCICLYNAPATMATHIRMQVNHDMAK